MRTTFVSAILLAGFAFAADEPVRKGDAKDEPLKQLAGRWVETSVIHSGEELLDTGRTSNEMSFDGKKFTEFTPSGKPLVSGEFKLATDGKKPWELDLPLKVFAKDGFKTVTAPAIIRVLDKDRLQIAYFDPKLMLAGKRPAAFESTRDNGVILLTLKRK